MVDVGEGGGIVAELSGPFTGGGSTGKLTEITLPVESWKGAKSPYSMAVSVEGLSQRSKIDLWPSVDILETLRIMGSGLCAENNAGSVTVYALGNKPDADLTVQATITEVSV